MTESAIDQSNQVAQAAARLRANQYGCATDITVDCATLAEAYLNGQSGELCEAAALAKRGEKWSK